MYLQRLLTIAALALCSAVPSFAAKAEPSDLYRLLKGYSADVSPSYRNTIQLFLDVAYSLAGDSSEENPVPLHVASTDSAYYASNDGVVEWRGFASSIVKALYKKEAARTLLRPLSGRVYDYQDLERFYAAAKKIGVDTSSAPRVFLLDSLSKYNPENIAEVKSFEVVMALVAIIMDSLDFAAAKHAAVLLDTLEKNIELYQNKYQQGFRNRNIIEYFASATFNTFIMKERKTLLSAPSPWELILLSKPMAAASSHSMGGSTSDSNTMYIIFPVAGIDRFNPGFTWYAGCSIFSAVPFAARPFKKTFVGIEAHVADKALLGYGWNIDNPKLQKLFVTVPLLGGWLSQ